MKTIRVLGYHRAAMIALVPRETDIEYRIRLIKANTNHLYTDKQIGKATDSELDRMGDRLNCPRR